MQSIEVMTMADVDIHLKPFDGNQKVGQKRHQLPHHTARLTAQNNKHTMSYHPDATEAISLTMPLRNASYSFDGMHPLFQMNLPEGALREAIERTTAKQYGSDDLTLLTILGNHQIGRLVYSFKDQTLSPQSDGQLTLEALLSHDDAQLFSQLLTRYAQTSGVAGVQPKVLMDIKSRLTMNTEQYIVKSWGAAYPELGCNEYVCMHIAKKAGLNVAETFLSDNGKLLISKRFDLDVLDTNAVDGKGAAMGFEDFCVLQAKGTREKYDGSIEQCANTVRHFVSAEHLADDLADLYKLTLLNVRLRNGDAHLKNMGIRYDGLKDYHENQTPMCSRKLAPIFDIVSTVPYLPNDTMALTLSGSKRWPKRKVLHNFARQHCLLTQKQITQIEEQVDNAIHSSLPLLDKLQQEHKGFEEVGDAMRKVFGLAL